MGFIFSCCRRRRDSLDTQPLLEDPDQAHEPSYSAHAFAKAVQVAGALKARKYPSQDQINRGIQLLLSSNLLQVRRGTNVSDETARILSSIRELLERVAQFGLEKNNDDVLQEMLFRASQSAQSSGPLFTTAQADASQGTDAHGDSFLKVPSAPEAAEDFATLQRSALRLFWLIITSSAFRLILSDAVLAVQEFLAATAVEVDASVMGVAEGAHKVEIIARRDQLSTSQVAQAAQELAADIKVIGIEKQQRLAALQVETAEKSKEALIQRIQQILASVKSDPSYRTALLSILAMGRKYADILQAIISSTADDSTVDTGPGFSLTADPQLATFISLFKTFAARVAPGYDIEILCDILHAVAVDIASIPDDAENSIKLFIGDAAAWLDASLTQEHYLQSGQGTRALDGLCNRARALFDPSSGSQLVIDMRQLSEEARRYAEYLSSDRATHGLIAAFDNLRIAVSDPIPTSIGEIASGFQRRRDLFARNVLFEILPLFLSAVKSIPFPRIEYADAAILAVLDTFTLAPVTLATSLLPDHIQIANWNEINVDNSSMDRTPPNVPSIVTAERFQLRLDGVRFAVEGLGYFLRYTPFTWSRLCYEDRGLLSVFAGDVTKSQGLAVDISLSIRPRGYGDEIGLYNIDHVRLDIPGLRFSLERTHHSLLNVLLLQPLMGPTIRWLVAQVLQEHLKGALSSLSVLLGRWQQLAEEEGHPDGKSVWLRYYNALLRLPELIAEEDSDDSELSDREEDQTPAKSTILTTTGIILATGTERMPMNDTQLAPETNVVAIGLAPQVVHHAAGPSNAGNSEMAGDATRGTQTALRRTREAVEKGATHLSESAAGVLSAAEDATHAASSSRIHEARERRRKGWRSEAFTFDDPV